MKLCPGKMPNKTVILSNPARKHPHPYSKAAYKGRNVIERMFCRFKDFCCIATRYDKRANIFLISNNACCYNHMARQLSPNLRFVQSTVPPSVTFGGGQPHLVRTPHYLADRPTAHPAAPRSSFLRHFHHHRERGPIGNFIIWPKVFQR